MEFFLGVAPIGLTCIAIAVAILTGYQNRRLSRQIAARQGVFRNPDVRLTLYGVDQHPGAHSTFVILSEIASGRPVVFPFLVGVSNGGAKAAKGVKLLVRYHRRLRGSGNPTVRAPSSMHVEFLDDGDFQITAFTIGTLAPRESTPLEDFLVFTHQSLLKVPIEARTKDGVDVAFTVEAWLTNLIDFTLYQEDDEPLAGRAELLILDTSESSAEQLLQRYNDNAKLQFVTRVGGKFKQIVHFYIRRWRGDAPGQSVHLIRYDVTKVAITTDSPVTQVAAETLEIFAGIEDITGAMYFRGINSAT